MKLIDRNDITCGLLAPLVAGPVFCLLIYLSSGPIGQEPIEGAGIFLVVSVLTLPFSYITTFLIGFPIYILLKIFHIDRYWLMALVGAPAAIFAPAVIGSGVDITDLTLIFALTGMSVSATFTFLKYKHNKSRQAVIQTGAA